jgi:hypothetical protein
LLVEEAGGRTYDFLSGDDALREGNAVLGCTPALWELIAAAMKLPLRR